MSTLNTLNLTGRDRALLRAVDAGRCDIVRTGIPDLRVDGRWFCDQPRAHALLAAGLMARAGAGARGAPATAQLTRAGRAALVDRCEQTVA